MHQSRTTRALRPSRHKGRLWALQLLLLLGFGLVVGKLRFVQDAYGPRLLHAAASAEQSNSVLLAPRGAIVDAYGRRLAYDVPAFMMDIKSGAFTNKDNLVAAIAESLGVSPAHVVTQLNLGRPWVRWPNPVLEPNKESLLHRLRGLVDNSGTAASQDITFTPTEERFYPNGAFASNTIGYVDHADVGQSGLEEEYNHVLTGTDGIYHYTRDALGFPLQTTVKVAQPAVAGDTIQLTLDQTIQGFVEHEMDNLVHTYHPEHAAIIVMNPQTGGILGMSSSPTYDPNQYWKGSSMALGNNFAVNNPFEPGSTFKVLTLAAALATHTVSLQDSFMSGQLTVAGHQINDWKYGGWGRITFQQALEYSSNVGFATIALKLGWPNLIHYMQAFGYLNKTGIDLPAEGSSLVFAPQSRGKIQLATSGFGQGIAVTPLQQMAAVGAIANGGRLMKPYLVSKIINGNTNQVVKEINPTVVNPQVVPPDVVKAVNHTMVLDVSAGIDSTGYLPGYDVAGKTGTANVVDQHTGKYFANRYIVSFIGYAPGYAPRVEVYVTLYWPKTAVNNQWGSTVATPAARTILQECLQYYHIAPDLNVQKQNTRGILAGSAATHYVELPALAGDSILQARREALRDGLQLQVIGSKGLVSKQWPVAGTEVPSNTTLYVATEIQAGEPVSVPNLSGTSLREAGNILAVLGLRLSAIGDGYAMSQSVQPGAKVLPGSIITVHFSPLRQPNFVGAAAKLGG